MQLNSERKLLIRFADDATGFEVRDRIKLILFAAGLKPATFIALKIHPGNLEERGHFERHLKACGIPFRADRPKSYEQIVGVKGDAVRWGLAGTWYGYDLFQTGKEAASFDRYVHAFRMRDHARADPLGAKLYGYPACCARQYAREHDLGYLKRKYTYYQFYHKLWMTDRKYPFIQHTPCSLSCAATKRLNAKYAAVVRRHAPAFWKRYTSVRRLKAELVVDDESDIFEDGPLFGTRTIWPRRDGHEYSLVCRKPIDGHYYLFSYLTRGKHERGTVLEAAITMKYDYADIRVKRADGVMPNLHHERHYAVPP